MVVPPAASSANLQQAVTASLEALTKAAINESQTVSIELARESLTEQKRGAAASQAALNALGSKVDALSSKVDILSCKQDSLVQLTRAQNLQWAIRSMSDGKLSSENFQYSDMTYGDGQTSDGVVEKCLLYFIRNVGRRISHDYYIGTPDDAGREAFRTKLSIQIHTLTGIKPRFEKEVFGRAEQWTVKIE